MIAHLVKANQAPETGTGWHLHEADFQIVIMSVDVEPVCAVPEPTPRE